MTLSHWLLIVAGVVGLLGLVMLFKGGSGRGGFGRFLRRLIGFALVLVAVVVGGSGWLLRHWAFLLDDRPVARLQIYQEAPQRFRVVLVTEEEPRREFELLGDEWQLDARVVRWTLPATLGGIPPVYRFERLSGRYGDPKQELSGERSVHDLRRDWDFWEIRQRWLADLPIADSRFGSATYLPMLNGASYEIYVSPRGGLVAKPADAATEKLLDEAGW